MFQQLDFIYMPSRDAASDLAYFTSVLGGRAVFAVEGMGTRVAMVELAEGSPPLLLAEHLSGEAPVLVYRVASLPEALAELQERGWARDTTFEIPQGPICSFVTPGGQRIAVYQRVRPEAEEHFTGRRDF